MALERVVPHTQAVGYSSRLISTSAMTYFSGTGQWSSHSRQITDAWSYKSPTVQGDRHPEGWRYPTDYRRAVQRVYSNGGFGYWNSAYNIGSDHLWYWIEGSDSRYYAAGTALWGGFVNLTTGGVLPPYSQLQRARAEAMLKVADMSADLSETLAGTKQTYAMIVKRLTQLMRSVRLAMRGKFNQAYRVATGRVPNGMSKDPRKNAQRWLELQYGWRPLVNDIYSLAEALEKGLRKPNRFKVSRTLTEPLDPKLGWEARNPPLRIHGLAEISTRVVLWGELTKPALATANSLALLNPAYFLWVRSPWTFVVDWVIPISDWLLSLTAPIGVQFVTGYEDRLAWAKTYAVHPNPGPGSQWESRHKFKLPAPSAELQMKAFQRVRYITWPYALPYWKSPFGSTTRIINAVALIISSRK